MRIYRKKACQSTNPNDFEYDVIDSNTIKDGESFIGLLIRGENLQHRFFQKEDGKLKSYYVSTLVVLQPACYEDLSPTPHQMPPEELKPIREKFTRFCYGKDPNTYMFKPTDIKRLKEKEDTKGLSVSEKFDKKELTYVDPTISGLSKRQQELLFFDDTVTPLYIAFRDYIRDSDKRVLQGSLGGDYALTEEEKRRLQPEEQKELLEHLQAEITIFRGLFLVPNAISKFSIKLIDPGSNPTVTIGHVVDFYTHCIQTKLGVDCVPPNKVIQISNKIRVKKLGEKVSDDENGVHNAEGLLGIQDAVFRSICLMLSLNVYRQKIDIKELFLNFRTFEVKIFDAMSYLLDAIEKDKVADKKEFKAAYDSIFAIYPEPPDAHSAEKLTWKNAFVLNLKAALSVLKQFPMVAQNILSKDKELSDADKCVIAEFIKELEIYGIDRYDPEIIKILHHAKLLTVSHVKKIMEHNNYTLSIIIESLKILIIRQIELNDAIIEALIVEPSTFNYNITQLLFLSEGKLTCQMVTAMARHTKLKTNILTLCNILKKEGIRLTSKVIEVIMDLDSKDLIELIGSLDALRAAEITPTAQMVEVIARMKNKNIVFELKKFKKAGIVFTDKFIRNIDTFISYLPTLTANIEQTPKLLQTLAQADDIAFTVNTLIELKKMSVNLTDEVLTAISHFNTAQGFLLLAHNNLLSVLLGDVLFVQKFIQHKNPIAFAEKLIERKEEIMKMLVGANLHNRVDALMVEVSDRVSSPLPSDSSPLNFNFLEAYFYHQEAKIWQYGLFYIHVLNVWKNRHCRDNDYVHTPVRQLTLWLFNRCNKNSQTLYDVDYTLFEKMIGNDELFSEVFYVCKKAYHWTFDSESDSTVESKRLLVVNHQKKLTLDNYAKQALDINYVEIEKLNKNSIVFVAVYNEYKRQFGDIFENLSIPLCDKQRAARQRVIDKFQSLSPKAAEVATSPNPSEKVKLTLAQEELLNTLYLYMLRSPVDLNKYGIFCDFLITKVIISRCFDAIIPLDYDDARKFALIEFSRSVQMHSFQFYKGLSDAQKVDCVLLQRIRNDILFQKLFDDAVSLLGWNCQQKLTDPIQEAARVAILKRRMKKLNAKVASIDYILLLSIENDEAFKAACLAEMSGYYEFFSVSRVGTKQESARQAVVERLKKLDVTGKGVFTPTSFIVPSLSQQDLIQAISSDVKSVVKPLNPANSSNPSGLLPPPKHPPKHWCLSENLIAAAKTLPFSLPFDAAVGKDNDETICLFLSFNENVATEYSQSLFDNFDIKGGRGGIKFVSKFGSKDQPFGILLTKYDLEILGVWEKEEIQAIVNPNSKPAAQSNPNVPKAAAPAV